jgi:hemerythrin-like domain-containing protein
MNNPIQIMLDEHEIISSAADVIKKLDHHWERNEDKFIENVHSLVNFFREYSDKYHHYKEEQTLFPTLENLDDFVVNSMVAELKEHHEMFREYTQSIEGHLTERQFTRAYAILCTYMDELLDHIAAENDELFVMAESLLSENELEAMYFKFKDIDIELGEDRKQELQEMLLAIN